MMLFTAAKTGFDSDAIDVARIDTGRWLTAWVLGCLLYIASGIFLHHDLEKYLQSRAASDIGIAHTKSLAMLFEDGIKDGELTYLSNNMNRWQQSVAIDASWRVLRARNMAIVYSSKNDAQKTAPPVKLSREEKYFYDNLKLIQKSAKAQQQQRLSYKDRIVIVEKGKAQLKVFYPVFYEDSVWGVIENTIKLTGDQSSLQGIMLDTQSILWSLLLVFGVISILLLVHFRINYLDRKQWSVISFLSVSALCYFVFYFSFESLFKDYGALLLSVNQSLWQLGAASGLNGNIDYMVTNQLYLLVQDHVLSNYFYDFKSSTLLFHNGLLLTGIFVGVSAFLFVITGTARRVKDAIITHKTAYSYALPVYISMLLLVLFPFLYGFGLSFTDTNLFNESATLAERWTGFKNYWQIIGDVSLYQASGAINYDNFYWTLFVTVCWTLINVLLGTVTGLVLALALNKPDLKYKAIYRTLLILPWAIPNYITALTWKGMFHQQFGAVNHLIQLFGGAPVAWFDSFFNAFLTGIITNGWLSFPFMMVVILGGLQSISSDMYEAARVEGATKWQQFWHITLPCLKPTLIPAIIISVVWTFNMFNVIFLVSGGDPGGSNDILIIKSYREAFEKYQYGYASAYSVIIFAILLAYGVFQSKVSKATESAR